MEALTSVDFHDNRALMRLLLTRIASVTLSQRCIFLPSAKNIREKYFSKQLISDELDVKLLLLYAMGKYSRHYFLVRFKISYFLLLFRRSCQLFPQFVRSQRDANPYFGPRWGRQDNNPIPTPSGWSCHNDSQWVFKFSACVFYLLTSYNYR